MKNAKKLTEEELQVKEKMFNEMLDFWNIKRKSNARKKTSLDAKKKKK